MSGVEKDRKKERKKERTIGDSERPNTLHMEKKKHPLVNHSDQATGRIQAEVCMCASPLSAHSDSGVETGQCVLTRSAEGCWRSARERSH